MASGFCGVTGARPVELGAKARPHARVARWVCDLHAVRPLPPLAQRLIRGEAFGAAQGLLKAGEHLGRERDGCARGHIGCQPGGHTAGGVDGQPMAHSGAMDAQQARHVLAAVGLPAGQQGQPLPAGLRMAVMCMVQALLERSDLFGDRRDGVAPGAPSRQA
jgi:hypothetical protein